MTKNEKMTPTFYFFSQGVKGFKFHVHHIGNSWETKKTGLKH